MPFDTEVGLGPGDIVLNWDPAPPRGHSSSHFSAHVLFLVSVSVEGQDLDGSGCTACGG